MKRELRDIKTAENSKFMNLMMMAMMMTNYNSIISPEVQRYHIPDRPTFDKVTPTSVLQDLGYLPKEQKEEDYQLALLRANQLREQGNNPNLKRKPTI